MSLAARHLLLLCHMQLTSQRSPPVATPVLPMMVRAQMGLAASELLLMLLLLSP
jgi:hypothetical protein